jgi:hypothetical protein
MTTKSMAATGDSPQRVSAQYVSAAELTTPVVVSSKRISRDRHATERDRDSDAYDRLVRQDCLLLGQVCNAGELLIVAGCADTFACWTTTRIQTFERECDEQFYTDIDSRSGYFGAKQVYSAATS